MPPSASTAYTALNNFDSTRETPDAAMSTADSKYGVSGLASQLSQLRGLTSNLQTAIGNVAPSVQGRTAGSLVTDAQRSAITNNEQAPLVKNFNDVSTNLNNVNQDFNNATGLATHYADSLLSSDAAKRTELFNTWQSLAQQEANQAAEAEKQREFNATLADQQAARAAAARSAAGSGLDLSALMGGAGAGQAAAAPTAQDHLNADIQRLITPDYATRFNSGYTEREILRLQQAYPEIDPNVVKNAVYQYRKQLTNT